MPFFELSNTDLSFPPAAAALDDPPGLLAMGGDLSVPRLLNAYRHGIFPWYEEGQPILWWSPTPRAVLFPQRLHRSRSLQKQLRRIDYHCTTDTVFSRVVAECARLNDRRRGTWITVDMQQAYQQLFDQGHAHSVEVWQDENLIGGLYGLAIGQIFFGESMFSLAPNGSKIALCALCDWLKEDGFELIDCQVGNPYLMDMGAEFLQRDEFQSFLKKYANLTTGRNGKWVRHWRSGDSTDKIVP